MSGTHDTLMSIASLVLGRADDGWTPGRFINETVRDAIKRGVLPPSTIGSELAGISDSTRQDLTDLFVRHNAGVLPRAQEACRVLADFKGTIRLRDFEAVGRWVTANAEFPRKVAEIKEETEKWVVEPGAKNRSYLLCGDSGCGKSFLVSELVAGLNPSIPVCSITLVPQIGTSADAWAGIEKKLKELARQEHEKACVFIDEVDTRLDGWYIFDRVYQYMEGIPDEDSWANPLLGNLIWFFAGSAASSESSFRAFCTTLQRNSKAVDFLSRLNNALELPRLTSSKERIVRACSIIKQKRPGIEAIEGIVLFYFGVSSFRTTRELATLVEKSLAKQLPSCPMLTWDSLALPLHTKLSFVRSHTQLAPDACLSVFRIE